MRRIIGSGLLAIACRGIAGLMIVLVGAAAPPPLDQLAGVYRERFANGTVDGHDYRSENILEIVPRTPASAYFRTHLEFFNGHSCDIWGIADRQADALVYDGPVNLEGHRCHLRLTVADGKIRFADPDGACRADTCGARGGYDGIDFKLGSRQPIRYLDRLLASPEYAEAVKRHDKPQRP